MKCTDLVPYDPDFAHWQEFDQAWEEFKEAILKAFEPILIPIIEAFQAMIEKIKALVDTVTDKIRTCIVPGRVLYLSRHSKSHRIRKKNQTRIQKQWRRLLRWISCSKGRKKH